MKNTWISLWLGVGLTATLAAQDPTTDVESLPGSRIEEAINQYLADRGLTAGTQPDGAFIVTQTRALTVATSSPNWVTARAIAFKAVQEDARAEFVEFLGTRVTAETVSELMDAPHVREQLLGVRPADLDEELQKKLDLLSAAKVDEALRELKVPEERIRELTAVQKHVELRQSIRMKATTEAFGRASGMRLLKTFEGEDAAGNYSVGVVAVWSPRQQAIAERIIRGETRPVGDGETIGIDLGELFVGEDGPVTSNHELAELLADEFGVRLVTAEDGRQAVIAFAQSGYVERPGNDRVNQMRRKVAQDRARQQARVEIQQFLATTVQTATESNREELFEEFVLEAKNGALDAPTPIAQFRDWFQRRTESRASGLQTGVVELKSWSAKHPIYGHPLCGTVLLWSPSSDEAADLARMGGSPGQRGTDGAGVQPGVRGSRDFEGKKNKKKKIKW